MKRIVRLGLLLLAMALLWGCGKSGGAEVADANGDGKLTCTLEIRCDALLDRKAEMKPEKAALVPEDGVILALTETEFEGGETVFDVFRRILRQEKIHFEYVDATAYATAYVEGIANLYEFDCGPQSGWVYSVNGNHQGIGCSSYTLADGDAIVFRYTCDLGADSGAENVNE